MKVQLHEREAQPFIGDGLANAIELGYCTDFAAFDARVDTRPYHVLRSRDDIASFTSVPDWRWHISVSGSAAVPKWADLVAIAHELRPGVCFVVGVPPRSWWINVHPYCLHLWELGDQALMAQWRSEAQGHTPT